jgi:hypothetical protein
VIDWLMQEGVRTYKGNAVRRHDDDDSIDRKAGGYLKV